LPTDIEYAAAYLRGEYRFMGMQNEAWHRALLVSNGVDVHGMKFDYLYS
jgi:hypothetical protein